jgi:hypothetical protein
MRNQYEDDARTVDDDDITPIDGVVQPPRGSARRGTVVVALDVVSGEFIGSDVPTPDPPDLAIRRLKWAGVFMVVKEN